MVPAMLVAVAIRRVPISAPLWRFRGLPKFLPIAVFSQMLNAAVSVVAEPLKMKDALHQVRTFSLLFSPRLFDKALVGV